MQDKSNAEFAKHFLRTVTLTLIALCAFVFIVDPYDALPFNPPLDRAPTSTNQRLAYPAIARAPIFDSAIFGTSTVRMLRPPRLNMALDARFANLSLNSGTWWEQIQLFKLFHRYHVTPKYIIWGIDTVWCRPHRPGPKLTPRPFPAWLYNESSLDNFLHMLNFATIEHAGQAVGIMLGINRPAFDADGFRNLNWRGAAYDLEKARKNIYGRKQGRALRQPLPVPQITHAQREMARYPNVTRLEQALAPLEITTQVILMMVPYHAWYLGAKNSEKELQYRECKTRVFNLARRMPNAVFVDFMFPSALTTQDRNYWDALHYNDAGMVQVEDGLIAAIRDPANVPDFVRTALERETAEKSEPKP